MAMVGLVKQGFSADHSSQVVELLMKSYYSTIYYLILSCRMSASHSSLVVIQLMYQRV